MELKLTRILKLHVCGLNNFLWKASLIFFFFLHLLKQIPFSSDFCFIHNLLHAPSCLKMGFWKHTTSRQLSQLVKLLHPSPHIFNYIVLIQSPLICLWFINAACLNYHHKQRICVSECFIINKVFMQKNSLHSHPRTLLNVNV